MTIRAYTVYFGLCILVVLFNLLARRRGLSVVVLGAGNAALVLLALIFMVGTSEPREWLSDFRKAYYPAGLFLFRNPLVMYSTHDLAFVNLPVVAVLFVPLAPLGITGAGWAFSLVGLAAIGLAYFLLLRLLRPTHEGKLMLAALLLLNGPLIYSVREGNLTHFLLPVLVGALFCLEQKRACALGILLGLAALIKPPLLLLTAFHGWKRRWRVVFSSLALLLGMGVISLALTGIECHRAWLETSIGPFANRPMTAYNVQSLAAFLARLLIGGDLGHGWQPLNVGPAFRALNYALAGILAAVTLRACRGSEAVAGGARLEFCAVLCLAVIISPVSWTHYYLVLLLPAALCLGNPEPDLRGRWAVLALLALALASPPVVGLGERGWWVRQIASHYLAGGLLMLAALCGALRSSSAQSPQRERGLLFLPR